MPNRYGSIASADEKNIVAQKAYELGCLDEAKGNFIEAAKLYLAGNDFRSAAEMFEMRAEIALEKGDYKEAAWNFAEAGVNHKALSDYFAAANLFEKAAKCFEIAGDGEQVCRYSFMAGKATNASTSPDRKFESAGEQFLVSANSSAEVSMKLEALSEACIAYANAGRIDRCREIWQHLVAVMTAKPHESTDEFHINRIIKVLDLDGFDELASSLHIFKMERKHREPYRGARSMSGPTSSESRTSALRRAAYVLWGETSDYGENVWKFGKSVMYVILVFAILYWPNPWGCGKLVLNHNGEFLHPAGEWPNWLFNFIAALSFSVTVFTTLGFGNITPANCLAHVAVILQVLLGYAFLGIFVTLMARRFLRKEY